jgi:hypothetical protein
MAEATTVKKRYGDNGLKGVGSNRTWEAGFDKNSRSSFGEQVSSWSLGSRF